MFSKPFSGPVPSLMYKSQLIRTVFVELFWADTEAVARILPVNGTTIGPPLAALLPHKVSDSNVTT
jgi:hypothetical protein